VANALIGIDLGGTTIKAVTMSESGQVLSRLSLPTNARDGRDTLLTRLADLIATLGNEPGGPPIRAVGVAVPGVTDAAAGIVEFTVALTPEWNGFAAAAALAQLTGLPVSLMNDAQAATLAEQVWGGGRGYRDFVCVTLGTGIGGGLVLDNRLYTGSRGLAGLIGHSTVLPDGFPCGCGNQGCIETVASGTAIARAARDAIRAGDAELRRLTGTDEPSPAQLATAAAAGSAGARRLFDEAGRHLGITLAIVVCLLNPMAIVIGGGVSQAGDLLLDPIRREIARRTTVMSREQGGVAVIQSPLGSEAGSIGSAVWAMRAEGTS
jgi:glucokinase